MGNIVIPTTKLIGTIQIFASSQYSFIDAQKEQTTIRDQLVFG